MPERDKYAKSFDGNPFEGMNANEVYKKLRWGKSPDEQWEIDGPECMATIGELARLDFDEWTYEWDEDDAPFLALGVDSNLLYVVPRKKDGSPIERIPKGPFTEVGQISRIDYYSQKGEELQYFYHDHQPPYPTVYQHKQTQLFVIVPADNKGSRSYAVDVEGIIG